MQPLAADGVQVTRAHSGKKNNHPGRAWKAAEMYRLEIFHPGRERPIATRHVDHASDTLKLISTLLQEHQGCERIVAWMGDTRMFAVDCKGNRLSD